MNDITETTIQDIIKKIQKELNLDNKSILAFDSIEKTFITIEFEDKQNFSENFFLNDGGRMEKGGCIFEGFTCLKLITLFKGFFLYQ